MKFSSMRKVALILTVLILGFSHLNAQTENDAINAFNKGVQLSQSKNYADAINAFQESIDLFDQLEMTDSENRMKAAEQVPSLQYKIAIGYYKQKDFDKAIEAFKKTQKLAAEYSNEKYESRAEKVIPQLYYIKGKSLYESGDADGALALYNKAIEMKPGYGTAYLRKAQVMKDKDNEEEFKKAIDAAIATSDNKIIGPAKKLAANYYLQKGAEAFKAENFATAESYFNSVFDYQEATANMHYQLALVYNGQSKWDNAIESCNKALTFFKGEETTKDAKIYYELGNAYKGKGDTNAACEAYKKAAKGDYAEHANYEIEHTLKCNK